MQYRKLGYTGYDVSEIGFGTWQIGGERWSANSEDERIELLRKSNDLGVNIFDVAVVYGQYIDIEGNLYSRSQELLGKAFGSRREQVIYCVKLGQFDEYTHRHDYDPKRVVYQFQQSLKRLKTDYIDICLIHAPSIEDVKSEKAITVLKTLQALGYVKCIGYSFEAEPEHTEIAINQSIDVIMLQYNLIDQACKDVIEKARLKGIGTLVGGPFKRGYLTGRFVNITDLPTEDDYWRWNINLNKGKVEAILSRIKNLLSYYGDEKTLRQENLDFILKEPNACSCIVGHRKLEEVIENINAIDFASGHLALNFDKKTHEKTE